MGIKDLLKKYGWILVFLLTACSEENPVPKQVYKPQSQAYTTEENVMVSKEIIRRQNDDILLLAKRYGWELKRTASGLFYNIDNKKGVGNHPQAQETAQIKGRIYTPNGKTVYDFKTDGVKELIINVSEDAVGLHELLKMMKVGQQAQAIIPSYLAYGIDGDGGKIPAYSPLICEIELVKINSK